MRTFAHDVLHHIRDKGEEKMIITSTTDDMQFGRHFLGDIMEWVVARFEPDDLYTKAQLSEYIQNTYEPDDIFSQEQLEGWAEGNL